jgi:hypothetical protein
MPTLACFFMAVYCAQYATGGEVQTVFTESMLWIWWIIAAIWALAGFNNMFRE